MDAGGKTVTAHNHARFNTIERTTYFCHRYKQAGWEEQQTRNWPKRRTRAPPPLLNSCRCDCHPVQNYTRLLSWQDWNWTEQYESVEWLVLTYSWRAVFGFRLATDKLIESSKCDRITVALGRQLRNAWDHQLCQLTLYFSVASRLTLKLHAPTQPHKYFE